MEFKRLGSTKTAHWKSAKWVVDVDYADGRSLMENGMPSIEDTAKRMCSPNSNRFENVTREAIKEVITKDGNPIVEAVRAELKQRWPVYFDGKTLNEDNAERLIKLLIGPLENELPVLISKYLSTVIENAFAECKLVIASICGLNKDV